MILKVQDLKKHYPIPQFLKAPLLVKALDGISFELQEKQTLAIVGESGCGKSTLAKLLIQIESPTSGEILVRGQSLSKWSHAERVENIQMVFQDPYSSINPRMKAWKIISEPLRIQKSISGAEARTRALEVMNQVGLRPELADRYPHMFSGGQRQRIGIARALMLKPKIMVCDEPISALDVSIQAQVLNLLLDLQDQHGLSYVFITHDLSVVEHIADQVLVMYLGKVVEYGSRDLLFSTPLHPYTQALLLSAPTVQGRNSSFSNRNAKPLEGELPSPLNPPQGCALHGRCPYVLEKCKTETPPLKPVSTGTGNHQVACHLI